MFPARKVSRKTLQLCSQVAETLSMVLGEMPDEVLRDLMVEEVQPAPDSSQLLVLLRPAPSAVAFDAVRALEHLNAAAKDLRLEVAGAIHRRRAPTLLFRVLGAGSSRQS
jgi:ribosome-binding factor A